MNKLFILLISITLAFVACKRDKPKPPPVENKDNNTLVATASKPKEFNAALETFIKALKSEDKAVVNSFIHPEQGYYFVLSTEGVYNDCIHYGNIDSLYQYAETASEYESNPFKYFLDALANLGEEELGVQEKDLFGVESCSFEEEGFYLDTNEPDVKTLTDVYSINAERDGIKLNPDELVQLSDTQNDLQKAVWLGSGEEADQLYFTQIDGEWYVSIFDLTECGS